MGDKELNVTESHCDGCWVRQALLISSDSLGHTSLKAKFKWLPLQNDKVLNAKNLLSCFKIAEIWNAKYTNTEKLLHFK